MPTSLGSFTLELTGCAAQPPTFTGAQPMQSVVGAGALPQVQACIVDWPQYWPSYPLPTVPAAAYTPPEQHTHYHFAQPLSDADVERIARRVAELLKGSGGNTP